MRLYHLLDFEQRRQCAEPTNPARVLLLATILWLHSRERKGEEKNQKPLAYHVPKVSARENLSSTSLGFAVIETCSVACYAQVYIVYCYCCQWSGKCDVFNRINNVKSSDSRRIIFFINISLLVSVGRSEIALPPALQKYCCAVLVLNKKRFTSNRTATF